MQARALVTTFSTIAIAAAVVLPAEASAARTSSSSPVAHIAASGGTEAGAALTGKAAGGVGVNKRKVKGLHKLVTKSVKGSLKASARSRDTSAFAPITAKRPAKEYTGPVFELNASNEAVPRLTPSSGEAVTSMTGGSTVAVTPSQPRLLVPGSTAEMIEGQAAAPMAAPASVREMIWAANEIVGKPYIYGGGHASFKSPGYDCSGTVSYALHGASLITTPMDSSEMMSWGGHGIGKWVTVFANPGHAYMTIAGLRLDTSPVDDPSDLEGPQWRPLRPANKGFAKRHPSGL